MTLNKIKLGTLARNATRMLVALLAVVFIGGGFSYATPQRGDYIYCASDDGRRNFCGVDTRGGVRLARQRSDSPCVAGRTWGFDRRGIWVDRGCRAEFLTGDSYRDRDYGRGRDDDRGRGRDGDMIVIVTATVMVIVAATVLFRPSIASPATGGAIIALKARAEQSA